MRRFLGSILLSLAIGCGGANAESTPATETPISAGNDELGFLDVPAMAHGARHAARLFYSYRPSDDHDGKKPLFVLMNGGPGFATSMGHVSWGIGPSTLREGAGGDVPTTNEARWTRFGNLLFLDERHAGFSYGIKPAIEDGRCTPLDDAADHLLAVLEFLAAHPELRRSRVVLVGESYGGMRVVSMLKLLHDPSLAPTEELRAAIRAHFDAVFPDLAGQPVPEERVASQFGDAVLIQPLVLGQMQYDAQRAMLQGDPLLGDPKKPAHDVRKTTEELVALDDRTMRAFGDAASRALLLGGRVEDVPLLRPEARKNAFRSAASLVTELDELADRDLTARVGPLVEGDRYFAPMTISCVAATGPESNQPWFPGLLATTRFFITNAHYDAAIHTPAIVVAMRAGGLLVDTTDDSFTVHLPKGDATVRWPKYESGHAVAMSAAKELADDVSAWIASRGAR